MITRQIRERHHQLKQLRAERAKVLEVQVEEAKIAMQRQLKLEKSQEKSRLDRLAFSKELIAEWNQLKVTSHFAVYLFFLIHFCLGS